MSPHTYGTRGATVALGLALLLIPHVSAVAQDPTSQPAESSKNWLGLRADPIDDNLITDRPDFTESTSLVPVGRMQLEGGYTYTYNDDDGVRAIDQTFPEYLLRIGLHKLLELRVGWAGMSLTEEIYMEANDVGRWVRRDEHVDGAGDTNLGVKVPFFGGDGLRPELGMIAQVSIPSGTDSKTSDDVDPEVKFLWAYGLTERLALSGNVNLAVPTSDGRRFFQTAASVSLGVSITDRWGVYTEYFGFYPNDRGQDCAHYVNGGTTFLITNNLQLDLRVGAGLNDEADDLFLGTGFAVRW
ncbi:MAG: transporter [Planctomycetes bacterium]|nr:transporter [Planctomycetota bacterium]